MTIWDLSRVNGLKLVVTLCYLIFHYNTHKTATKSQYLSSASLPDSLPGSSELGSLVLLPGVVNRRAKFEEWVSCYIFARGLRAGVESLPGLTPTSMGVLQIC
jgi:hypothetical protein